LVMTKVSSLTVNVKIKSTWTYKFVLWSIPITARLFTVQSMVKGMSWLASKGMFLKIKIGNGKWKRSRFEIDYEMRGECDG
jgi:hypothetical protein